MRLGRSAGSLAAVWGVVLSLFLPGPAQAQTLISNMGGGDGGVALLDAPRAVGVGFALPAGANYQLNFATVRLVVQDTASVANFAIHADSGGNPTGAPLVTFAPPSLTSGSADYTLTPSAPLQLNAGTTYWLVGSALASSENAVGWGFSLPFPGVLPTGIATSVGTRLSPTGGLPTDTTPIRPNYSIDASPLADAPPVPEPASLALFAPALGLMVVLRKRRIG